MKKFLLALAISISFLSLSTPANAQSNRIIDSVVMVVLPNKNNEIISYGTGFFISPFGHILTNEHVISGGKLFQICFQFPDEVDVTCYDSSKLKILAKDSDLDLALLQLPQIPNAYNNGFLTFGDSDLSQIGDEINVLGYPGNDLIDFSLAKGLITEFFQDYILTDAQLFPGNSGSPAFNSKNQVIGIAVAKFGNDNNSTGILISSNAIKKWLISIRFNPQNPTNRLVKSKKSLKFISKQGGFSIDFPGNPISFSEDQSTVFGKVRTNYHVYKKDENKILLVSYFDIAPKQLKEFYSSKSLKEDDYVNDFLGSINIEEAEVNKYHNEIFYKAKTSEGYFLIAQIYIIKNRFYQIASIKKDAYPDEDEMNNFIKSFKLISS